MGGPMTGPKYRQLSSLTGPERHLAEALFEARAEADRVRLGRPIRPRVQRLLCGCVDPDIGPTVVRADGTCAACSP